jgi:hypothetical protein
MSRIGMLAVDQWTVGLLDHNLGQQTISSHLQGWCKVNPSIEMEIFIVTALRISLIEIDFRDGEILLYTLK